MKLENYKTKKSMLVSAILAFSLGLGSLSACAPQRATQQGGTTVGPVPSGSMQNEAKQPDSDAGSDNEDGAGAGGSAGSGSGSGGGAGAGGGGGAGDSGN